MTGGTVSDSVDLDIVLLHEFLPHRYLIPDRFVGEVEYFALRPDVFFGVPVAIEAPGHEQRMRLPRQRHLVDTPVACHTANTLGNVNAVIEVHKVRKIVHPYPFQWFVCSVTVPNGF